jgi:copper chaperone CopZ
MAFVLIDSRGIRSTCTEGGRTDVEKTVFEVPKMYADHHVQAVRNALLQLEGIGEVLASSAYRRVAVAYDAARLNVAAIEQALETAGYAPGEEWKLPEIPEGKEDSSPWFQTIQRVTSTHPADREMSGEHRKY